jgi:2-polyprenyl-3-methyl-5-hydroxy-6-metoxy-1,4-benzoquinol methylase
LSLPTHCPACHGTEFRLEHQMSNQTELHRCESCGLVARDRIMTPDECKQRYSDRSYFFKSTTPTEGLYGYNDYLRYRDIHMFLCTVRLDEIEEYTEPGKLLDLGCGPGVLLDSARARGWEISGLDISSYAVEIARAYYNISVVEGEFVEAGFPGEHFDVVTMDDFLEHTPNPREVIVEAARVIKSGGLLAISTPNPSGISAWLMGRQWFHYKQEEHFYLFSRESLRRILEELDFEILTIHRSPRIVDLQFIAMRLGYYSSLAKRMLLSIGRSLIRSRVAFPIYTGEVRVIARKRSRAG